ncbi:hypothetical protein THRCLA_02893 [Thraustotheca clavata]|uniref:Secreted protein n=1 Tax=Thraustotheca clavata TaxID=74557 RepID=A0A0A7CLS0_9STRA|nr:secreted protein [Thraustotheca clavata]OQS04916.1 hypothetical protein THRCLA_02893 [Thraustotheca clavata]
MVKFVQFILASSLIAITSAETPCTPQPDPFEIYDSTPCTEVPRTPAPTSENPTPTTAPVNPTATPAPTSTTAPVPTTSSPGPATTAPVPTTSSPGPATTAPVPTVSPVPTSATPEPTSSAPSSTIRFCSFNRQAISEYYGEIYSDVFRNNVNEQFVFTPSANSIRSQSNGQCLDAYLDSNNAFQVHTYACLSTNPNQQWTYNTNTQRIEHLTHKGLCLTSVTAGNKARVEPCSSSLQQLFSSCEKPEPVQLRLQTCYTNSWVSEYNTGLYADVLRGNANENFSYDPVSQTLKVSSNGECLDAFATGNGKYGLHTYACDATNGNQKWILESHRVKHATHTNLCLDADPKDDPHHVQVWECTPYNKNQCWNIVHN